MVLDVLDGVDREEMTWEYQREAPHSAGMRELYERYNQPWIDYPEMVAALRAKGLAGLNPLLSETQHRELATTRDVTRMVELVLLGLANAP
jgi:hypothetical protein